jgi:hypothetical protein
MPIVAIKAKAKVTPRPVHIPPHDSSTVFSVFGREEFPVKPEREGEAEGSRVAPFTVGPDVGLTVGRDDGVMSVVGSSVRCDGYGVGVVITEKGDGVGSTGGGEKLGDALGDSLGD